jgi:hypothetical protein
MYAGQFSTFILVFSCYDSIYQITGYKKSTAEAVLFRTLCNVYNLR